MGKQIYILLIVIIIFIILIFPFKIKIAKKRLLTIVDVDGNPMTSVIIRHNWDNYSLNIRGEIDYSVDDKGRVHIKEQTAKTNIISVILGTIKELSKTGIHTSFGSSESIGVLAEGYKDIWFYDEQGLIPNVIAVKKKK